MLLDSFGVYDVRVIFIVIFLDGSCFLIGSEDLIVKFWNRLGGLK